MKNVFTAFLLIISIASSAQSVSIMSYNIRYATEQDGENAWSKRKNEVFELLTKYSPDVIGVQEALHTQLEDLINALPDYAFVGVGRDDGKNAGEFSAILYKTEKFKIREQNTFWLSENPSQPGSKSWDAAITRVATWCKMEDKETGKLFFVMNTHFDHIGTEARKNSALLIKKQLTSLNKNLPFILTGDFNCTRDDAPYQALVKPNGQKILDPAPQPAPGTFCDFKVNAIECRPIDYILHGVDWIPSNYKVITDNDGSHYPSDHLPVMVNLVLQK